MFKSFLPSLPILSRTLARALARATTCAMTCTMTCTMVLACGGSQKPDANSTANDQCSDFELDVKKVWSEETKVKVQADFMGQWGGTLGADVAQQRAQSVGTSMDRIAQDWVMLRRSVCMDHYKRGLGTDAEYQARVDCFNRVLSRQRMVLEQLNKDADAATTAMDGLNGELDSCR
jgi:hypothetical protein